MSSPVLFAFILALGCSAEASVTQLSLSASAGGQVSRWGAACQTALAAGLVGLPESAEPGFLPVCSESRAHGRPRWQLLEKSPDVVSHPEVAGHSSSCPAPKCTCSAPACSGGQPHGWG